jgi:hypothetical protein
MPLVAGCWGDRWLLVVGRRGRGRGRVRVDGDNTKGLLLLAVRQKTKAVGEYTNAAAVGCSGESKRGIQKGCCCWLVGERGCMG